MNAVRIHDREVLETPMVQELFVSAFKDEEELEASDVWMWCRQRVDNPNVAIIVARNDSSELVGLATANFSPSVWSPDPWVSYLYSNGEKKVVGALLAEIRVWGLGLGQERVRWHNGAGISDKAYVRFVNQYLDARPDGSVLVGKWKEA